MGKHRARGLRNNNPFNIRIGPSGWLGKIPLTANTDGTFEQFESAVMGIRAGVKLILNHASNHKANTVAKLIAIWAPPSENNTVMYAFKVAAHAGVDPDDIVNWRDYKFLYRAIEAMISVENGDMPYKKRELDEALMLAGIRIYRP